MVTCFFFNVAYKKDILIKGCKSLKKQSKENIVTILNSNNMRKFINNIIENVDIIAVVTLSVALFALACSSANKWFTIVSLIY